MGCSALPPRHDARAVQQHTAPQRHLLCRHSPARQWAASSGQQRCRRVRAGSGHVRHASERSGEGRPTALHTHAHTPPTLAGTPTSQPCVPTVAGNRVQAPTRRLWLVPLRPCPHLCGCSARVLAVATAPALQRRMAAATTPVPVRHVTHVTHPTRLTAWCVAVAQCVTSAAARDGMRAVVWWTAHAGRRTTAPRPKQPCVHPHRPPPLFPCLHTSHRCVLPAHTSARLLRPLVLCVLCCVVWRRTTRRSVA